MALGLGDIRVLSRSGQPLLAEIPVISNEPGELQQARVAMASAETFARVGLQRPQGLAEDLQFTLTQDASGRAVIRVTSRRPVTQAAIGFLIEVDWGKGRLVREYSALIDAPSTTIAVAEPTIEVPASERPALSNAIVREPEPAPVSKPEPLPQPEQLPEPAVSAIAAEPLRQTAETPPAPAPAPAPVVPRPAAAVAADGKLPPVRAGQTLSEIALGLARDSGRTLNQTMLALQRANPDAFIADNINLLKQGAVLRTPEQDELTRIGAAEASTLVREQVAQWQQARNPMQQPADAGMSPPAQPALTEVAVARASGARLEIAPAAASATSMAGTTSGISAGGEGNILADQELLQAREDIATRDAEIEELRSRVGELEKLREQQQQLIALKDEDLAAAQRKLGAGEGAGDYSMWLWGALVLLIVGVTAWLISRQRKPSPLPLRERHEFETPALSDAEVLEATDPSPASMYTDDGIAGEHQSEPAGLPDDELAQYVAEQESSFQPETEPEFTDIELDDPAQIEPDSIRPHVFESQVDAAGQPESSASADEDSGIVAADAFAGSRDRLELAVAYLDLGDTDTARNLLQEVVASGDPGVCAEAEEILGRIG